MNNAGEGNSGF